MNYKQSLYNFLFPYNDEYILYNARTAALSLIDHTHHKIFEDFCNKNEPIADEEFLNQLDSCGFIIPETLDESQLLRLKVNQSRFNSSHLSLTIAPTLNCNFRCIYCFEQDSIRNLVMDENVQNEILNLVRQRAKSLGYLHVVWYGGEPLLSMDIIERLSTELIQICDENNIDYDAMIVTNGYLLDEPTAVKLNKLKVTFAQITLDGPQEVHDKRRVLAGGQGTFDKIISNLVESGSHLNHISLRVNVDHDNVDKAEKVLQVLEENGLSEHINCHLGQVRNDNDNYNPERCMTIENFTQHQLEFMRKKGDTPMALYPLNRTNYCGADFFNSFLIDPEGYLYSCWNDIGMEDMRIGSIFSEDNTKFNFPYHMEYMLYDATQDPRCVECKFLPVCMGGCPYQRIRKMDNCIETKPIIEEHLAECVRHMIETNTTMEHTGDRTLTATRSS